MGDFNCEPEELIETAWLRRIKGNILATQDATISSGSVLGVAILSHSLWGRMELEIQHVGPTLWAAWHFTSGRASAPILQDAGRQAAPGFVLRSEASLGILC